MSNDLSSFILNNKKFVKLKDGESIRGVYRGFKVVQSRFDEEKETVSYKLSLPGMADGKVVSWENGSINVAELMSNISVGEEIVITRHGSGTSDTTYTIVPVEETKAVASAKK